MKQNYHAIVLDKRDIGEADRLYTFYTKENGLMRTVARSVRKPDARMAAQVEDFTCVHIAIAKNGGRGTLAGAVAEQYHSNVRSDFEALRNVDRARQTFVSLVHEYDADARLYALWEEYLLQMDALAWARDNQPSGAVSLRWVTHAFLMQLYALLGYTFRTQKCTVCAQGLCVERCGFSAHRGGVVCRQCMRDERVCVADADTVKALRVMMAHPLAQLHKIVVNTAVERQLALITRDIAQWIVR